MKKAKKIYQSIISCLTIFLFCLTIYVLIAGTIAIKNNKVMSVFGYTFSVVPTDSMEPVINVGDSVIGKKVDYDSLEIGDDIIYHYVYDKYDMYVVHRIVRKDENGFKTKGVNPKITSEDPIYVTKDNFVAKVVWSGSMGNIGEIVIKNRGTLFIVLAVILLFIAINGIFDIVKILDEKKKLDQQDEIDKQKEEWQKELRKQVEEELAKEKEDKK